MYLGCVKNFCFVNILLERVMLRAIHDFNPIQMNRREKREFHIILNRGISVSLEDMLPEDERDKEEDELKTIEDTSCNIREEISVIQDRGEANKMKELETLTRQKELVTDQEDMQNMSFFEERCDSKEMNLWAAEWESDSETTSSDLEESHFAYDNVDPFAAEWESYWESCDSDERYLSDPDPDATAIPFERGEKMEAIPSANIG